MPESAVNEFIRRCKEGRQGKKGSLGRRVWEGMKKKDCRAWAERMVAILENSGVKFADPVRQHVTDEQFTALTKGVKQMADDPKAKVRNRGTCCLPAEHEKVTDNQDHFPINDEDQARNALARVAQLEKSPSWFDGTLKELQATVQKRIKREYPDIEVTMAEQYAGPSTMRELDEMLRAKVQEKYGPKEGSKEISPYPYMVDVLVSERAVIVRKADGQLVQVPYDIDEEGGFILEDEIPVKQEYVPQYAEEIETVDLDGVELFMAGAVETPEFDEDDIAAMAEAGNELAGEVKPPVFLGHTRNHGWPSFGWIKNFQAKGSRLLGDLKQVPVTIAKWIKSGGFKRVSAEILPEYESESGKKYKNIFYGLALLGQDIPRLKLLRDLPIPVYDEGACPESFVFPCDREMKITKGGESSMTDQVKKVEVEEARYAELQEKEKKLDGLKDVEQKFAEATESIKTKDAKITELQGKVDAAEKRFAEIAAKAKSDKISAAIETLKKDGRIAPASEGEVKKFAEGLDDSKVEEYGEGDQKVKMTQLDRYLKQLGESKAVIDFSVKSKQGQPENEDIGKADEELAVRVKKYAEEHKCSQRDALRAVVTSEDAKHFAEVIR